MRYATPTIIPVLAMKRQTVVSSVLMSVVLLLGGCRTSAPSHAVPHEPEWIDKIRRKQRLDIDASGKHLVFVGMGQNASTDLYLLRLDTLEVQALTQTPVDEFDPVFNKEGTEVVYGADSSLKCLNLRTRQVRTVYTSNNFVPFAPVVGQRGRQVFYVQAGGTRSYSFGGTRATNYRVWSISTAGRSRTPTLVSSFQADTIHSLAISPQETQLALSADLRGSADTGIYLIHLPSGKVVPALVHRDINFGEVAFLPSGEEVVYIADPPKSPTQYNIYRLHLKSGAVFRVTNFSNHYLIGLAPSKDGKYVYFCVWDKSVSVELWRVRLSDGLQERIADSSLFESPLKWRPEERR